jgi:hypothetical protein
LRQGQSIRHSIPRCSACPTAVTNLTYPTREEQGCSQLKLATASVREAAVLRCAQATLRRKGHGLPGCCAVISLSE